MIESLGNDRHAITIRTIAVLPRPIRELTASPVRGSATLLLLTTALAPAPLTLARSWRLLRNAIKTRKCRKERERSCNSQRPHSTR
jgi:hypothetical protein